MKCDSVRLRTRNANQFRGDICTAFLRGSVSLYAAGKARWITDLPLASVVYIHTSAFRFFLYFSVI